MYGQVAMLITAWKLLGLIVTIGSVTEIAPHLLAMSHTGHVILGVIAVLLVLYRKRLTDTPPPRSHWRVSTLQTRTGVAGVRVYTIGEPRG